MVKTTLIVEDMSTDGSNEGMLLFSFLGMDALVNVGGSQEKLILPEMSFVIGADDLVPAFQGTLYTDYSAVCGAIEQVGASRLMTLVK